MSGLSRHLLVPALVVALTAVACGGDSTSPLTRATSTTVAPTVAPGRINITTQTIAEETDRYVIKLSYPQTGIAAADAQIKKIVDANVADIKDAAKDPRAVNSAAGRYTLDGGFTTSLAGPDIVSISLGVSNYLGGAHGAHHIFGLNFDKTGKALTLDDALAMTKLTLTQLADQLRQQLTAKLGRDFIFPEGVTPDRKNFETFLVSADQVTFVFQEYQVAPYVAGIQQVAVPRR